MKTKVHYILLRAHYMSLKVQALLVRNPKRAKLFTKLEKKASQLKNLTEK